MCVESGGVVYISGRTHKKLITAVSVGTKIGKRGQKKYEELNFFCTFFCTIWIFFSMCMFFKIILRSLFTHSTNIYGVGVRH